MDSKKIDEGKPWYRSIMDGLFEIGSSFFVTLFGLSIIAIVVLLATRFFR
jgi:hypothetical protein